MYIATSMDYQKLILDDLLKYHSFMNTSEWLGLKDAAEHFKVSKSTIVRRAKAGTIKSDKTLSRHTCYSTENFVKFNITKSRNSKQITITRI